MKITLVSLIIVLFIIPSFLPAAPLEFLTLWKQIEENSSNRKSKYLELKSVEIAKNRNSKHWLPRIYTDFKNYQTNDPALNFLGKLGQRRAVDSDFSTNSSTKKISNFLDSNNQFHDKLNPDSVNLFSNDKLNYPGSNNYSRVTLGFDLPIYEGRSGETFLNIFEKKTLGLRLEWLAIKDHEYAESGFHYRALQSLNEYKYKIKQIRHIESNFQSNYQLRNKGNPIGYNGYLALKSLSNILNISEKQIDILIQEHKNILSLLSAIEADEIITEDIDLYSFLELYFKMPMEFENSNLLKAEHNFVEGEKLKSDLEMSKFLPKIGAYGETYTVHGNRNLANAYQVGFYLQMNLYNPKDIETVEEAKLNAESKIEKLKGKSAEEEIQIRHLIQLEKSLNESLSILKESNKLQNEQIENTLKLFQSGAVSAMQFAEVLSRSANMARNIMEAEISFLRVRTEISKFGKRD